MTINEFLKMRDAYMAAETNSAQSTQYQRRLVSDSFVQVLRDNNIDTVDKNAVLVYRSSMVGYKGSTINNKLKYLRAMFNWGVNMGIIEVNPVLRRFNAKEKKEKKPVLSEKEVKQLIQSFPNEGSQPKLTTWRAFCVLLVLSGMRESEMIHVKPKDIDWEKGSVLLTETKNGSQRDVPFMFDAQFCVKDYMNTCRPKDATDDDFLFVTRKGKDGKYRKISRTMVKYGVKKYVEEITGRTDISPHSLRHTFASYMCAYEVNVRDIQKILGHSSIAVTDRYLNDLTGSSTAVERAANAIQRICAR